ncbi:hypothetical protein [Rubellimicrobium arenae]|uniref:hypothetical protein n=1 Tax=Rubellimicrobium arenae TaxID=2817372 RepID=UPI001B30E2E7|nr:hypothetical protein [Rubellimicrobium arenae]
MAETLIMAVLRSEPLGRWHRRVLEELRGLLALERIDDLEDTEARPFVCLDPEDPKVHVCCRHFDALDDIVRQLRTEEPAAQDGGRQIGIQAPAT